MSTVPPSRLGGLVWLATLAGLALAAGCKREPTAVTPPHPPQVAATSPQVVAPTAVANPASPCADLCRIALGLRCRNQGECEPRCRSMLTLPVCKTEVSAFFTCLRAQPAPNWECDSDDIPAIRDPFCDQQQATLAACMDSSLTRSPR